MVNAYLSALSWPDSRLVQGEYIVAQQHVVATEHAVELIHLQLWKTHQYRAMMQRQQDMCDASSML